MTKIPARSQGRLRLEGPARVIGTEPLTLTAKPFGDRNAEALTADIAAIKAVIAQVLGRIHELDPILGEAIEGGFEDAASEIRVLGARARKGTGANQFVRAIATTESLQAAALDRSRLRPRAANDNR